MEGLKRKTGYIRGLSLWQHPSKVNMMALLAAENKYLIHSASWILLHFLPLSNKLAVHSAVLSLFLNRLHLPWLRTLAHLCVLASWFCFDSLTDSPHSYLPSPPPPWFRLALGCILLTTSAICLFNKREDQSNHRIRSSQTTPPFHAVGQLPHPPGKSGGLFSGENISGLGDTRARLRGRGNRMAVTVSFSIWGKQSNFFGHRISFFRKKHIYYIFRGYVRVNWPIELIGQIVGWREER